MYVCTRAHVDMHKSTFAHPVAPNNTVLGTKCSARRLVLTRLKLRFLRKLCILLYAWSILPSLLPWRACAARVTVLALCVCLSVCLLPL